MSQVLLVPSASAVPVKLSVNVNAIAFLRNRREVPWPSLVGLSRTALLSGAAGITVHPRPDERHIRLADVTDLKSLLADEFPSYEFNIEGYPDQRFLDLVERFRPQQVTLVPDDPSQSTSDHGWDIAKHGEALKSIITRLKSFDMRVSLFIDPDEKAPALAKAMGADRVEIYTGPYGGAFQPAQIHTELQKILKTGQAAAKAGVDLNAGHDLTVANLTALTSALPNLREVSIGHGLISDALTYGMAEAVKRFLTVLSPAKSQS